LTTTIFKGGSPLIESADQLASHFRSGEKPREAWRIGTEHEKFGFVGQGGQPLAYDGQPGVKMLLEGLAARYGWSPIRENGNAVALVRGEGSITLEPGGQFELSGAALENAHQTREEIALHSREIHEVSRDLGISWLVMGENPVQTAAETPWMPKARYGIMRDYLPGRGTMALDMMLSTATVQTNIDYSDEEDMALKMGAAMRLAPFITALFANSPFSGGRPNGWLSRRSLIWENTDPDRCGFLPGVLQGGFRYRDYLEYALDAPMFFIYRQGNYVSFAGESFRRFMANGRDGHRATLEDWELHLTTLFPVVRLKKYLELRMADMGTLEMISAYAALTRGLFYDTTSLGQVRDLVEKLPADKYPAWQQEAARAGFRADIQGRPCLEWVRDMLAIARGGLDRLNVRDGEGNSESVLLEPLDEIVRSGKTLAERLLELWEGPWERNIGNIFQTPAALF